LPKSPAKLSRKDHQEANGSGIIDPLDGTTNYAHGYPCFCVSIAVEQGGTLEIGVVYDPMRNEMFAAERGQGATLNERRIKVSNVEELNRAMMCTGFPYDVRTRQDFRARLHKLYVAMLRRLDVMVRQRWISPMSRAADSMGFGRMG
jgi:fructose-1,6-bisphosphatase/inositol monophosphatase family enzyme